MGASPASLAGLVAFLGLRTVCVASYRTLAWLNYPAIERLAFAAPRRALGRHRNRRDATCARVLRFAFGGRSSRHRRAESHQPLRAIRFAGRFSLARTPCTFPMVRTIRRRAARVRWPTLQEIERGSRRCASRSNPPRSCGPNLGTTGRDMRVNFVEIPPSKCPQLDAKWNQSLISPAINRPFVARILCGNNSDVAESLADRRFNSRFSLHR